MSYHEPKSTKQKKSHRRLVTRDVPASLKKRGITAVYDNLAPNEYLNVGKEFAVMFRPELEKALAEMKLKKK
jgi:hypothetical protein